MQFVNSAWCPSCHIQATSIPTRPSLSMNIGNLLYTKVDIQQVDHETLFILQSNLQKHFCTLRIISRWYVSAVSTIFKYYYQIISNFQFTSTPLYLQPAISLNIRLYIELGHHFTIYRGCVEMINKVVRNTINGTKGSHITGFTLQMAPL